MVYVSGDRPKITVARLRSIRLKSEADRSKKVLPDKEFSPVTSVGKLQKALTEGKAELEVRPVSSSSQKVVPKVEPRVDVTPSTGVSRRRVDSVSTTPSTLPTSVVLREIERKIKNPDVDISNKPYIESEKSGFKEKIVKAYNVAEQERQKAQISQSPEAFTKSAEAVGLGLAKTIVVTVPEVVEKVDPFTGVRDFLKGVVSPYVKPKPSPSDFVEQKRVISGAKDFFVDNFGRLGNIPSKSKDVFVKKFVPVVNPFPSNPIITPVPSGVVERAKIIKDVGDYVSGNKQLVPAVIVAGGLAYGETLRTRPVGEFVEQTVFLGSPKIIEGASKVASSVGKAGKWFDTRVFSYRASKFADELDSISRFSKDYGYDFAKESTRVGETGVAEIINPSKTKNLPVISGERPSGLPVTEFDVVKPKGIVPPEGGGYKNFNKLQTRLYDIPEVVVVEEPSFVFKIVEPDNFVTYEVIPENLRLVSSKPVEDSLLFAQPNPNRISKSVNPFIEELSLREPTSAEVLAEASQKAGQSNIYDFGQRLIRNRAGEVIAVDTTGVGFDKPSLIPEVVGSTDFSKQLKIPEGVKGFSEPSIVLPKVGLKKGQLLLPELTQEEVNILSKGGGSVPLGVGLDIPESILGGIRKVNKKSPFDALSDLFNSKKIRPKTYSVLDSPYVPPPDVVYEPVDVTGVVGVPFAGYRLEKPFVDVFKPDIRGFSGVDSVLKGANVESPRVVYEPLTGVVTGVRTGLLGVPKAGTSLTPVSRSVVDVVPDVKDRVRSESLVDTSTAQDVISVQDVIPIQDTVTVQDTVSNQLGDVISRNVGDRGFRDDFVRLEVPRVPRIILPSISPFVPKKSFVSAGKDVFGKSFGVEIRRGGKFFKVGTGLSKVAGLDLLAGKLGRSLAVTGRLIPEKGLPRITKGTGDFARFSKDFRTYKLVRGKRVPLKNTFIQKRGKRLGTSGEVEEIGFFRKKKKGVKKGGGGFL